MRWYSRATKDQLTGLVFGLAAAWTNVQDNETKSLVQLIALNVYLKLKKDNWKIRDASGKNDTSADDVDSSLKLAVLALANSVGSEEAQDEYEDDWKQFVGLFGILGVGDRYIDFLPPPRQAGWGIPEET